MLFWLTCVFVSFWFVYYHWKRRKLYRLAAKIPGPTAYPLIGNAHKFLFYTDIVQNTRDVLEKYGSTLRLWMFNVLVIAITKPKHVQIVLTTCLEKDSRYNFAKEAFGNGLLTAPVNIWKNHRKIINPAFNQQILDSFIDIFSKQSGVLIKQLSQELENDEFDVHEYLSRCSLDIICETAMGVTVNAQTQPSKLLHLTRRAAQILVERSVRVWLHPDIIFKYSQQGREMKAVLDYTQSYTGELVMKRYKEFHNKNKTAVEKNRKKPFLEHLLALSDQMTFLELRNEVDLFITAGSDTVTTTTGYVLVCLGMYPEIQEEVVKELNEVFGLNSDRQITREDLPKLVYMERVIKETMRLYPPVPLIARSVTEDVDLGDLVLPSGSTAVICIIGTHRDPNIWPNPLKFDPNRFTSEEIAKRHPYSFIPFSGGPRNCIGIKFAMMSMKVLLATILRSYKIHTKIRPQDIKLSVEIVSKMIGGANISITKR